MTNSRRVLSDTELDLSVPVYVDESSDAWRAMPAEPLQGAAPVGNEAATQGELDGHALAYPGSTEVGERWQRIQAGFVDDPRQAVADAQELVGELTSRIAATFASERAWQSAASVSTEELRVCLQRYRALFERLLPLLREPQPTTTNTAHH